MFNPDREKLRDRRKDSIHGQLSEQMGLFDQNSPDLRSISFLLLLFLKTTFLCAKIMNR